ncbi:hypothetical protein FOL47_001656 [Perkinsus chesapeaki]|uniref:Peptidase A1 domain-containing protein n=1 Tax=Perkinsus chesapeaki TaxID=330153 RepID=A0A7J6MJ61_PERCH|nr:hypothetical protein FOL47_001656 [Perkinsus chesapeaki]
MYSTLVLLTPLSRVVVAEALVLPVVEEFISLGLDGQKNDLLVDTGTARSFAIHGPSYERLNGEGSCGKLRSGCYFCPRENPCEDILQRKRWRVAFGSGEYEYVEHTLTLTIGAAVIKDFTFGLAIKHSGVRCEPHGYLGLSFGRRSLPETVLEQLKRRGIIADLVYAIHIKGPMGSTSGVLSLGDAQLVGGESVKMDPRRPPELHRKPAVPLSMIQLVDIQGVLHLHAAVEGATAGDSTPMLVDSGLGVIDVPASVFDLINLVMIDSLTQEGSKISVGDRGHKEIIWEDNCGWVVVRDKHAKYLPDIVYCIGEGPDCIQLRIQPKHYIQNCNRGYCFLAVARIPNRRALGLGQPLFRAYAIGFDLSRERFSFTAIEPGVELPAEGN